MSKEDAENYKKIMTERMGNCTTVGENRDKNERLEVGFGRGMNQAKGMRQGKGMDFGKNVTKAQ